MVVMCMRRRTLEMLKAHLPRIPDVCKSWSHAQVKLTLVSPTEVWVTFTTGMATNGTYVRFPLPSSMIATLKARLGNRKCLL